MKCEVCGKEHDGSYVSESNPRYNTIEVAIERAKLAAEDLGMEVYDGLLAEDKVFVDNVALNITQHKTGCIEVNIDSRLTKWTIDKTIKVIKIIQPIYKVLESTFKTLAPMFNNVINPLKDLFKNSDKEIEELFKEENNENKTSKYDNESKDNTEINSEYYDGMIFNV